MKNRWNESEIAGAPLIEQLIYQSRLVGAEESLVLWGGGNNSVKRQGYDPLGNQIDVMDVKGSGSDMKSITAAQFPGVRLDYIRSLISRDSMADEEMVEFLARCLLDPKSPRPSIETLLHAFLPAVSVLHTHADAILAVTNNRGRERTVRECFGENVLIVPYVRPGFAMSRQVADLAAESADARGLVMMNHGLLTWGASPKEAYDRHIELVTEAEEYLAARRKPSAVTSQASAPAADVADLGLRIRGALSSARRVVLRFDGSEEALRFAAKENLDELLIRGAATPDHLLHTGRYPMVVRPSDAGRLDEAIRNAMEQHREMYERYFRENQDAPAEMLSSDPRIVIVPGAGIWTAGRDARGSRIVSDIFSHTRRIVENAEGAGGYESLPDSEMWRGEYWPLELYKLTLLPKDKELAGHVALVTGGAGAIGRATCLRLASEGAHVCVADLNESAAHEVAEEICRLNGLGRAFALRMDVTDRASVEHGFQQLALRYGGVDVVVSNAGIAKGGSLIDLDDESWESSMAVNTTGHFFVTREAMRMMKAQGTGGSLVYNATKNVTAPGSRFGAYSISKAAEAQLCRIAAIEGSEIGVRANMVNPDAVFDRSGLWQEIGPERAAAHGISLDELPEFYRKRNLLKARVTAEDVAEAILFLAGPRSARTTGTMLPVDGGIREAFPR